MSDADYWKEFFRQRREQTARELEAAERAAAASGKEPFELARLADLLGEAPAELAPRAHELREKYYVGHKELRTLEEFAQFIRELEVWEW